ncbi:MAG: tetratricopeptide repeat protein [Bacteroidetes bacterium]|nr:tetratricopeptide repeat protein [Bacteroidota bacterium]
MEHFFSEKKIFFFLAALCILTTLLYSGMLNYPITTNDDIVFFTKYPEILNLSWNSIGRYFSSYHASLYQPLTVLTFAINYHFTGTSPLSLHLVNLIFHLINIILVFFFFNNLLKKPLVAILIAFLFALHPMNVEAVTWISARSSTMYACFYLLSLIFYLRYSKGSQQIHLLFLSLLFFILSLFSKVQAVTLPLVLLLLDYYTNRRNLKVVLIEKLPFLILSLVFIIIAFSNSETSTVYTHSKLKLFTTFDILFLNGGSLFFYLQKFLVPVDLSAVYLFPVKTNSGLPAGYYCYTCLILVLGILIYRFRKNRDLILGVGIFLLAISINLPLISVRSVIVADRYAYFPFLGLMMLVALFLHSFGCNHLSSGRKYIQGVTLFLLLYGSFYAYETWEANKKWENDLTLSTNIIDRNPPVPSIAKIYRKRGNYFASHQMLKEAVSDYSKAIELDPENTDSFIKRAYIYLQLNDPEKALPDLDKGIENKPDASVLYSTRAMVKLNTGDALGAWADCNKSLALDSANAEAYNFRAILKFRSKDIHGAELDLRSAVRFNNQYAEAYKNLGTVLFQVNNLTQACYYWKTAARLGNREAAQLVRSNCR